MYSSDLHADEASWGPVVSDIVLRAQVCNASIDVGLGSTYLKVVDIFQDPQRRILWVRRLIEAWITVCGVNLMRLEERSEAFKIRARRIAQAIDRLLELDAVAGSLMAFGSTHVHVALKRCGQKC